MHVLAIDLGQRKSVGLLYDTQTSDERYWTVPTTPGEIHDLVVEAQPGRVVIEIGPSAGWVHDLIVALEIEVQVANTNHQAWRWRSARRKTDRLDALKLAQLSAMNQLPTVYMPSPQVRQWRSLITYRHTLIGERTRIKNQIRSILTREGIHWPAGPQGWSKQKIGELRRMAKPIAKVDAQNLWQGQLWIELKRLAEIQPHIKRVEDKLDAQAQKNEHVKLLRTIPGVGPRLSETLVAVIDDPKRFDNRKQVSAYIGLVPSQYQSGSTNRHGHITRQGHRLLRSLLVEVAWLGRQHNSWSKQTFEHLQRGCKARTKIAIIGLARRLLVRCWAMMRDGTPWKDATPIVAIPASG